MNRSSRSSAGASVIAIAISASLMQPVSAMSEPQRETCPEVRVGNPEGNYIVPGTWGSITYKTVDGSPLLLDAYVQRGSGERPAVILVHGGGWTSGSRITYLTQLMELLTEAGYNWFSVDYRLAPAHRFPAALEDLRSALAFIRCNFRRFRIDPHKIVLLGDDAGAHLAALLASERPEGVRALVTFGGMFDLRKLERFAATGRDSLFTKLFGDREGDRGELLAAASPTLLLSSGFPDTLAVYGTRDSEVPVGQSIDFCEAVRRVGGRCDLLAVEGAIHLPENWRPEQWGYKNDVLKWLARTVRHERRSLVPYRGRLTKNIEFGSYRDSSLKKTPLLMDAYIPEGPGPFAGVVIVHGGGWEAGDKVTYVSPIFEPLARAGLAWFSIDYRLTPRHSHPDQLADLRRAIRYIKASAGRFGIDPGRLALVGESASGQMAAQIATEGCTGDPGSADPAERESCTVRAVVSFYGVYDFLPMVSDTSPRSLLVRLFGISVLDDAAREVLRRYSPIHQVHREMPPFLLIHGTNERLWAQGVEMEKRLREAGVAVELLALEGAPHGMENWEGHAQWMGYKDELVRWLRANLTP